VARANEFTGNKYTKCPFGHWSSAFGVVLSQRGFQRLIRQPAGRLLREAKACIPSGRATPLDRPLVGAAGPFAISYRAAAQNPLIGISAVCSLDPLPGVAGHVEAAVRACACQQAS